MRKNLFIAICVLTLMFSCSSPSPSSDPATKVLQILDQPRKYSTVPEKLFNQLGWQLPDGGRHVKTIADAAAAFDPKKIQDLPADQLGYQASWHIQRFSFYGLDWDITGLKLQPNEPMDGMPTLAIINGGSTNWYEFLVDPLNGPGIAQYLAQKIPIILVTIPGNYKPGGWDQDNSERIPEYLIGQDLSVREGYIRNAIYTFKLVAEGVRLLLENISSGPLLIVGHSTGGELQFMLKNSSLKPRLRDLSLGWGSGPPASIKKEYDEQIGTRAGRVERYGRFVAWKARSRSPEGYVSAHYVGPLNPIQAASPLEVALKWFELEGTRRPHFKQTLQDIEHQGMIENAKKMETEIRKILTNNPYKIIPETVINDLFSPSRAPLENYRKMVWVVAQLDANHWNQKEPEKSLEVFTAERFRETNPDIPIRVLLLEAPITHYGHIERARQVAGSLLAATEWISQ